MGGFQRSAKGLSSLQGGPLPVTVTSRVVPMETKTPVTHVIRRFTGAPYLHLQRSYGAHPVKFQFFQFLALERHCQAPHPWDESPPPKPHPCQPWRRWVGWQTGGETTIVLVQDGFLQGKPNKNMEEEIIIHVNIYVEMSSLCTKVSILYMDKMKIDSINIK